MEKDPTKPKKATKKKTTKPKSVLRKQPPLKVTKVNLQVPKKKVPPEPAKPTPEKKKAPTKTPKPLKEEVKKPEPEKNEPVKPQKTAEQLAKEAITKCGVKNNKWTKAALQKYNNLYVPEGYRAGTMGDLGFQGWAPLMKQVMLCEKHRVPNVVPINKMGVSICPFCGY